MALGNYDNNQKDSVFRPNVYGYSMGNTGESALDKTNLSFTMWKSTIKISISPAVEGGSGERTEWNWKGAVSIYLTPTKALQFAEILRKYKEDPDTYNGWGVFAGKGFISVCNGKAFGGSKDCIVVQAISEEGTVTAQYAYEFKTDYHKVLESFNSETGEFVENTDMFKDIEIGQVITQLSDYATAASNAIAFSVVDNLAWTFHYQNRDIEKIAAKLGVNLENQKASSSNKSYFNNTSKTGDSNTQRQSGTMADIIGK